LESPGNVRGFLLFELEMSGRLLEHHMWMSPHVEGAWSVARGDRNQMARICRIDHVLLAMPAGRESDARAFYQEILGIPEVVKPPQLAARGGCWFEAGALKVHLGVEKNFIPARKAHPAFVVDDLKGLMSSLENAGYTLTLDAPLEGYDRIFVDDPFGNRIELLQPKASP
jgi:catechol 2,3-dioxygenase-like lactoylglutathione lyase family enzyme